MLKFGAIFLFAEVQWFSEKLSTKEGNILTSQTSQGILSKEKSQEESSNRTRWSFPEYSRQISYAQSAIQLVHFA